MLLLLHCFLMVYCDAVVYCRLRFVSAPLRMSVCFTMSHFKCYDGTTVLLCFRSLLCSLFLLLRYFHHHKHTSSTYLQGCDLRCCALAISCTWSASMLPLVWYLCFRVLMSLTSTVVCSVEMVGLDAGVDLVLAFLRFSLLRACISDLALTFIANHKYKHQHHYLSAASCVWIRDHTFFWVLMR